MGVLNITDVQPGMRLASPIVSPQGVMLLRKETSITSKHILLFKTWGILEADIEGMEAKDLMNVDPAGSNNEELLWRQEVLEHRFSGVLDNEIMADIFRIAKKQLAEKFYSL